MTRTEMIEAMTQAGSLETMSGQLIDAEEDLGGVICGSLFGDMSDFYTDVFYEKTEMLIRLVFQANGIHLSVPDLADREYGPGVLPYADLGDNELAALHALVQTSMPSE